MTKRRGGRETSPQPAEEPCLVCQGRGKQYDTDTGEWTKKPCLACDGTGKARWREATKKKRGSDPRLQRISTTIAQRAQTYEEYRRECAMAGLPPLNREGFMARAKREEAR